MPRASGIRSTFPNQHVHHEGHEEKAYGPGEWGPPIRDPASGRVVWNRRETPLWRAPGLAALVLAGAGLAWIVRRRAGLR